MIRNMQSAFRSVRSTVDLQPLVSATTFELVPLKNLEAQLAHLPAGARVSVTCSPTKGIEATLDLAAALRAGGFRPTPHLAARLVRDRAHVGDIAARLAADGTEELFLIGGDEEQPAGPYDGVVALLEDLLAEPHGLRRIGIAGYPDGHLFISAGDVRAALHRKQTLLGAAGLDGWVSTQMCFDGRRIAGWITAERANGLTLPIRLGVPGPVDRAKLLTMGMRVGVGQSLRYLTKNRKGLTKLLASGAYDPLSLLESLGAAPAALGIEGLHLFTFNQLEAAAEWQRAVLDGGTVG